ncbi:MAG: glycosyltransferase family 2 protein, partial [Saprospiraceae bacterium]
MQISVIIPVFNAAQYVTEAVQSALQQPETAEVILIEDGSTDDSLQVIEELKAQYAKVKVIQWADGQNHGPAATRNLGIDHAKYEFIAFLDADDFYLPNRFLKTRQLLQTQPKLQVAYAPVGFFYANEKAKQLHQQYNSGIKVADFQVVNKELFFEKYVLGEQGYIHFNGITLRKKVFQNVEKFDLRLRHAEDTDLILRFALVDLIHSTTDAQPVASTRIHPLRSVYNLPKMYQGRSLFFQKWLYLSTQNHWSKAVRQFLLRRTLEMEFLAKYG